MKAPATIEEWTDRWLFEKRRPPFALSDEKVIGVAGFASAQGAARHWALAIEAGLQAALITVEEKKAILVAVWNHTLLESRIDKNIAAVAASGWPVATTPFLLKAVTEEPPRGVTFDFVCSLFGDFTNSLRSEFASEDWQEKIRSVTAQMKPPTPASLWPVVEQPETPPEPLAEVDTPGQVEGHDA